MRNPLQAFWANIPGEDRKLIRITVIACAVILLASLASLFLYTRYSSHGDDPAAQAKSDSSSGAPIPLPDSGADEVAGTDSSKGDTLMQPDAAQAVAGKFSGEGMDSFDAEAHRQLMSIAASKYEFSRSLAHLQRIEGRYRSEPGFLAEAGRIYLEGGFPTEAIPRLAEALAQKNDPQVAADLALAQFRANAVDSARQRIERALRDFPGNPLLLSHQAAMMGEAGNADEKRKANVLFLELLRKHTDFAEGHYQYGRYFMNQGNMKSSLSELRTAIRLAPLDPRTQARLGMCYFYLKQDQAAEQSYRTALALNPLDYNTWFNLGELYLSQANESTNSKQVRDKTRAALQAYLTALGLYPELGAAHYRTGTILNGNRQYREAIAHLQKALEKDPRSVGVLLQLATAWSNLDETPKALQYLDAAHEIDPFNKVVVSQWNSLRKQSAP